MSQSCSSLVSDDAEPVTPSLLHSVTLHSMTRFRMSQSCSSLVSDDPEPAPPSKPGPVVTWNKVRVWESRLVSESNGWCGRDGVWQSNGNGVRE
jgi:hypothetical protein